MVVKFIHEVKRCYHKMVMDNQQTVEIFQGTWPTPFIMATCSKRVVNISPFFMTSKYFSSRSLPVVLVDMVPSDNRI